MAVERMALGRSSNEPVLIIAEAGVNHDGLETKALALADAAKGSGADVVKFQTFIATSLVTKRAEKAGYQAEATGPATQFSMLKDLELSRDAQMRVKAYCDNIGIEFLSTAFDIDGIDFLRELGVRRLKVPSGEITNLPYLRHVARCGLPVIMSTGMARLSEVASAVEVLVHPHLERQGVTLLHCTSEYPAPISSVNLRAMQTMREAFGLPVGYSDHTTDFVASVMAVGFDAPIIEKHLTLDRSDVGPDHRASLSPSEFRQFVEALRRAEDALGNGVKEPQSGEASNASVVRKSIVASRQIARGEVFTEENLTTKRPGTGISPMQWDAVVGCVASRDFQEDDLIEL